MFFLPHLYDAQSYLIQTDENEVDEFYPALENIPQDYSREIEEFTNLIMARNNLQRPQDIIQALESFAFLRDEAANHN